MAEGEKLQNNGVLRMPSAIKIEDRMQNRLEHAKAKTGYRSYNILIEALLEYALKDWDSFVHFVQNDTYLSNPDRFVCTRREKVNLTYAG